MFFHRTKIALMDRHECIVISDATSVQPLWHSCLYHGIIWLVTEEVAVEVAIGGAEEDLRRL